MRVIRLESQNVKKLKAISITPDANTVIVGGENEQGKSSTLDSIMYAIGGKKFYDKAPVRRGTKSAKISCDLGEVGLPEILITRTITESGGGQITITNAEGQQFASPQAMLDKLTGKLTFDPLAFSEMDDKKQLETLKQLVGLDFAAIDAERATVYAERTRVNAEAKSLKARVDSIQVVNAPDEEVSVISLTQKLEAAQRQNQENDAVRSEIQKLNSVILEAGTEITRLENKIADLKKQRELDEEMRDEILTPALKDNIDDTLILKQVQDADATNQKVRAKRQRKEMEKEYMAKTVTSEALTMQIEEIDQSKAEQLASAKFPVAGLSFDETGVSFEGTPFSQCSSAQKLRVSVAMGMALNPDLRVLLIRNGSLLDTKNLELVKQMANDENFQIWIERVGTGKECSVIISDGEIQ